MAFAIRGIDVHGIRDGATRHGGGSDGRDA
jgi:hypothetical protein